MEAFFINAARSVWTSVASAAALRRRKPSRRRMPETPARDDAKPAGTGSESRDHSRRASALASVSAKTFACAAPTASTKASADVANSNSVALPKNYARGTLRRPNAADARALVGALCSLGPRPAPVRATLLRATRRFGASLKPNCRATARRPSVLLRCQRPRAAPRAVAAPAASPRSNRNPPTPSDPDGRPRR